MGISGVGDLLRVSAALQRDLGNGRTHPHGHSRAVVLNSGDDTFTLDGQVALRRHIEQAADTAAGDVVAGQVDGDRIITIDRVIGLGVDILQQGDGRAALRGLSRIDSSLQRVILDAVDLGSGILLRHLIHAALVLGSGITGSQRRAVGGGVSGEAAAGDKDLGALRQCGIVRSLVKDQRGAGNHVLAVANIALSSAGAVERTARDLHITGACNDAGAIGDFEGTAADGDVVVPRCIDAAGNVARGHDAADEGAALDEDRVGLAVTLAAVAGDDSVIGGDQRCLGPDLNLRAGRRTGDHRALAALERAGVHGQAGVVADCHGHVARGLDGADTARALNVRRAVDEQRRTRGRNVVANQIEVYRLASGEHGSLRQRDIRQQTHGGAALGRIDSRLQRLVLDVVNLGNVNAFLDAVGAVRVGGGDITGGAVFFLDRAGERTAGDGDLVVGSEGRLGVVRPVVGLDGSIGAIRLELTAGDLDLVQALVAGAVHDGDSRAVLNGAVILGLVDRAAGDSDRAAGIDAQAAGADLNAHGLGVDGAVVDGQLAAAGEVDAEAVGDIQRTILQRDGIVGVVAVGLDTAVAVGRHGDALEHQTGVVVGNGPVHTYNRGDQTHHGVTGHSTVLHGQRHVGVVDLKRGVIRISAGVGPSFAVQVDGEALIAGVLLRAGGVVTLHDDRLVRLNSVERLVHGVVCSVANLGKHLLLLHAVLAVAVLNRRIALVAVPRFNRVVERTARNLDGGLGSINDAGQFAGRRVVAAGIQLAVDGAAGNSNGRFLTLSIAVVHRGDITVDGAAADRERGV